MQHRARQRKENRLGMGKLQPLANLCKARIITRNEVLGQRFESARLFYTICLLPRRRGSASSTLGSHQRQTGLEERNRPVFWARASLAHIKKAGEVAFVVGDLS